VEERLERESREMEERWKENEGRMKSMEERMETGGSSVLGEEEMESEWKKNKEGNTRDDVN
jgi:hypothetical protein